MLSVEDDRFRYNRVLRTISFWCEDRTFRFRHLHVSLRHFILTLDDDDKSQQNTGVYKIVENRFVVYSHSDSFQLVPFYFFFIFCLGFCLSTTDVEWRA